MIQLYTSEMDIYKNVDFCLFIFEIINVLNIGEGTASEATSVGHTQL